MSVQNVVSVILAVFTAMLVLTSCTENTGTNNEYMQITQKEAKNIMDTQAGYMILDVRTEEEFAEGHISGAILIPDYEIGERAESELTDKDQLILVYCRSGRRSQNAAKELISLGYNNVKDFGGIIDWQYETVK
jgi:phage shock protein E